MRTGWPIPSVFWAGRPAGAPQERVAMRVVEALAHRATVRRLTALEARDALVAWLVERGEAQVRRAMRYTAPGAGEAEVERALRLRARSFFDRLASPWADPTWADLRRVKGRMCSWLLPRPGEARELERESALWDLLLVGTPAPRRRAS